MGFHDWIKVGALLSLAGISACGADDASQTLAPTVAVQDPAPTVGPNQVPAAGEAMMAAPQMVAPPAQVDSAPPAPTDVVPPPVVGDDSAGWCEVKQTLDSNCVACHDGQRTAGAPMALLTYDDLHAAAPSDAQKRVFELVGARVHDPVRPMPPQAKLTPEQLGAIDGWVAAGAPAGADPTCAQNPVVEPPAQAWPDNCDETYQIFTTNGGSPNVVGAGVETHPKVAVTAPWGNEEVQAIAWRAIVDNARVLHHWILYGPQGEFLFGWAPGKDTNEDLPEDVGVYLPPGRMTLDIHYNNATGTQREMDASGVEICVLKRANFRPKTATTASNLASYLINLPAGARDQEVTGTCTHSGAPVRLLSVSPHAHRTAHHMKFTVEKANGETIVMHDASFNYAEQTTYPLNPAVVVEAGDRIVTTCTFTNDTDTTIRFGQNTSDEMCFNFALYEPKGGLNCGAGGVRGFGGQ